MSVFLLSLLFVKALSPEEIRERVRLICAGEPGEKAGFPEILAIALAEEKSVRLKVVNQTIPFIMYIYSPIRFLIMLYFCSRSDCESHNLVRVNIPP